jgi:hypothetical protein
MPCVFADLLCVGLHRRLQEQVVGVVVGVGAARALALEVVGGEKVLLALGRGQVPEREAREDGQVIGREAREGGQMSERGGRDDGNMLRDAVEGIQRHPAAFMTVIRARL